MFAFCKQRYLLNWEPNYMHVYSETSPIIVTYSQVSVVRIVVKV